MNTRPSNEAPFGAVPPIPFRRARACLSGVELAGCYYNRLEQLQVLLALARKIAAANP